MLKVHRNHWYGLGALVLATTLGLLISAHVDGVPAKATDATEFTCSETEPQVCLNDIQRFAGDRSQLVAQSVSVISDLGFPKVRKVIASLDLNLRVKESQELSTNFEPWYTDAEVVYASSSAYSSEVLNHLCDSEDFDKQYEAFELLQDWSTSYALREVLGTKDQVSDPILRSMPFEQQRRWALTTYESLSECKVPSLPGKL